MSLILRILEIKSGCERRQELLHQRSPKGPPFCPTHQPSIRRAQGGYQVAFGVPNMGKVCTEAHVPSFVAAAPQLKELGIRLPVICLAQGSPDQVARWQQGLGLDTSLVQPVIDVGGRLTRFLGLNYPESSADGGPKSLRWAALIDHGVLLQTVSRCWGMGGRERNHLLLVHFLYIRGQ